MAGRRPKPTALKLISGNAGKRKPKTSEPKPTPGVPPCPAHLADTAKAAWGVLAPMLANLGLLSEMDGHALERLVSCYADILECEALVDRDGFTYKTTGTTGERLIKANPAVAQLRAADAQFKSYLIEFGLTPSARTRVHATPAKPAENPFLRNGVLPGGRRRDGSG